MLREYAVDPGCLGRLGPAWMLMEQIDVAEGRVVAEAPKKWRRMVYDAIEAANCPPVEKKSLVHRLERLTECLARGKSRNYPTDAPSWLAGAIEMHSVEPFDAIISEDGSVEHPAILKPLTVTRDDPLWRGNRGAVVPRSPKAIADCVASLGSLSRELLFVDPYLSSDGSRLRVVGEILRRSILLSRPPSRIELHSSERAGDLGSFGIAIRREIIDRFPAPIEIRVFKWRRRDDGDRMHPRFFLTERGGVRIDYGLETGVSGETTDIQLLDREIYQQRWSDYQRETSAFELVDSIAIR